MIIWDCCILKLWLFSAFQWFRKLGPPILTSCSILWNLKNSFMVYDQVKSNFFQKLRHELSFYIRYIFFVLQSLRTLNSKHPPFYLLCPSFLHVYKHGPPWFPSGRWCRSNEKNRRTWHSDAFIDKSGRRGGLTARQPDTGALKHLLNSGQASGKTVLLAERTVRPRITVLIGWIWGRLSWGYGIFGRALLVDMGEIELEDRWTVVRTFHWLREIFVSQKKPWTTYHFQYRAISHCATGTVPSFGE